MNKKAVELSMNMIVVIIVALVTLGLVLVFVNKLFDDVEVPRFPVPEVTATADEPIVVVPVEVERGKATGMSISFFNAEEADVTTSTIPSIECVGITDIEFSAGGLNIPVASENNYHVIVKAPKTAKVGVYPCTLTISATQKQFKLEVI